MLLFRSVLIIHSAQMETLGLLVRPKVEERVISHLLARYPDKCRTIDNARLRAVAERYIATAVEHGVTTIESIAFLCGWFFELGEQFERSPAGDKALAILRDPLFPGQIKVLLVAECLEEVSGGRVLVASDDEGMWP